MQKSRIQTIRKSLIAALFAALCLLASANDARSQSTASSIRTEQTETEEQRRLRLIDALERAQDEVKASRNYINGLENQIKSKQAIIDAQSKRQMLSDEAIASLQREVQIAKEVIASQQKTIELDTAEIKRLRDEINRVNKKLKTSRKLNKYLLGGVAAAIIVILIK